MAVEWFGKKAYKILAQNWRYRHWEVDLIASRNGILHFIEIKTRTSLLFGFPEEKVSRKKIRHLIGASEEYLHLYPQWKRVQFDILSINIDTNAGRTDYFLIEDVYE